MVGPAPDPGSHPEANTVPLLTVNIPEMSPCLKFPDPGLDTNSIFSVSYL